MNTGQSHIAAKRFIVLEAIAVDFIEAFELEIQELKIGDPMDEETDIGPLAKKEFLDSLERVLKDVKKRKVQNLTFTERSRVRVFSSGRPSFLQPVTI